MKREDFFTWLDTIIDEGNSDWEVVEDFADGNIWIKFNNIEDLLDNTPTTTQGLQHDTDLHAVRTGE